MRPDISFLGQPIRSLQTMLRVISVDDGVVPNVIPDGIYGPQTMTAVSAFQRMAHLPVTGVTDSQTWEAIRAAYQPALIRQQTCQPISALMNAGQVIQKGQQWGFLPVAQAMLLVLSQLYPQIPAPAVTGALDEATEQSLVALQTYCCLPITGQLDKITWKHLAMQFTVNAARLERMNCASHKQDAS